MANNRLYLVVPTYDQDEPRRVLLAKGWSNGWNVWEPDTIAKRLSDALSDADIGAACGGKTTITLEDEN